MSEWVVEQILTGMSSCWTAQRITATIMATDAAKILVSGESSSIDASCDVYLQPDGWTHIWWYHGPHI